MSSGYDDYSGNYGGGPTTYVGPGTVIPRPGLTYAQELQMRAHETAQNRPNPQVPGSQFTSAPRGGTQTVQQAFQSGAPPAGTNWNTANVRPATDQGQNTAGQMGMQDTGQRVGAGAAGEQQTMSLGQKAAAVSKSLGQIQTVLDNAQKARDRIMGLNIGHIASSIPSPDEFRQMQYMNRLNTPQMQQFQTS
jgi:hypothetical protein